MVDLLSTDRVPRQWTDSQPSTVEAGVTTFQLLEDYAQGYEQRIRAHGNQTSPGDLLLIDRPLFQPPAQAGQLLGPQAGSLVARLTVMRIFPPTPPNTEPVLLYAGNADHNLAAGVISAQDSFRSGDANPVFPNHWRHRHIRTRTRNDHSRPPYFQQRAVHLRRVAVGRVLVD
jgi:hypothetical protein